MWEAAYLVAENEVVPGQEPRVPETRGAPAGEEMQAGGADSLALQQVVGHDIVEAYGGEVLLVEVLPGFSTTSLVDRAREGKA